MLLSLPLEFQKNFSMSSHDFFLKEKVRFRKMSKLFTVKTRSIRAILRRNSVKVEEVEMFIPLKIRKRRIYRHLGRTQFFKEKKNLVGKNFFPSSREKTTKTTSTRYITTMITTMTTIITPVTWRKLTHPVIFINFFSPPFN